MTVKEQRSVVFKVNIQDEFFRGVSKELNEGCLFVETEEGINIKIKDDIKKQIIFSLSSEMDKQVIISKMDMTSYNSSEIEMIANTINGYILTIKTQDIFCLEISK